MVSLAFGPISSRRLGRSLGINNVPYKVCTYSCIYCQLGETTNKIIRRRRFYKPEDILTEVEKRVKDIYLKDEHIDYLTFVPDGEPTLDANLGREISLLKRIGIPIAVLTNASLLWNKDVRKSLLEADLVSLKVDAVSKELWRLVNKPHESLQINRILEGVRRFTEEFNGVVISETMIIDGIEYNGEFERIGRFLEGLDNLSVAYISVPVRPPSEKWVKPARREILNEAFQIFSRILGGSRVKFLVEHEGNDFAFTGRIEDEILGIAAVHPIRKEAMIKLLEKAKADWQIVEKLLQEGRLVKLEYNGNEYYRAKPI